MEGEGIRGIKREKESSLREGASLVPRPPRPAFVACSTKSGGRPGRIYHAWTDLPPTYRSSSQQENSADTQTVKSLKTRIAELEAACHISTRFAYMLIYRYPFHHHLICNL